VCLDSGCGDYERLWNTTSLRGLVMGELRVQVLTEGVHSGDGSGVVASSFRIARSLLSRIEDERTGKVKLPELHVKIPKNRVAEANLTARVLGKTVYSKLPWVAGGKPVARDTAELLLNRTFRPALSITGVAGMPAMQDAGNVLRAFTALKLSMRVPPTCDTQRATKKLKQALEREPPYGAHVQFEAEQPGPGWNAPALAPWLASVLDRASQDCFGKKSCAIGEGGSIPFMGMLGEKFPKAQFFITGVLGPHSNAHGPNEFLHVPTAKRLTECVSRVIVAHQARESSAPRKRSKKR
jgi:acetylornithine deacetylase/succinyl-diaminopimelate desuccinylase-like protein